MVECARKTELCQRVILLFHFVSFLTSSVGSHLLLLGPIFVAYARNTVLLANMVNVGLFYVFSLDVRNLTENIKSPSRIIFYVIRY